MNSGTPIDNVPPAPEEARKLSARSRRGARLYPLFLVGAVSLSLVVLLLGSLWGGSTSTSWSFWGAGAGVALLGLCGWWLLVATVRRRKPGDDVGGFCAWFGFSLSFFALLAMIPLLILAVSGDARRLLDPGDRMVAHLEGNELEVCFPRATFADDSGRPVAINLTFDDIPIPADYFQEEPDVYSWSDYRVHGDRRCLRIDFGRLRERFQLDPPRRLGINAIADAPQILDASRKRFPQQWIGLAD